MESSFLPPNYQQPASNSRYVKLVVGDNKFRFLGKPITGWVDWTAERKPVRTVEMPEQAIDPKKPPRHFWALPVWDYTSGSIKIWEITEAGIIEALIGFDSNQAWGSPLNYDITVNRQGQTFDTTKYQVTPCPPTAITPEIEQAKANTPIDLNKLYAGEDPFLNSDSNAVATEAPANAPVPPATPPVQTPPAPPAPTGTALPPTGEPPAPEDDIQIENIPY